MQISILAIINETYLQWLKTVKSENGGLTYTRVNTVCLEALTCLGPDVTISAQAIRWGIQQSLRRAPNIFVPEDIDCITIIITSREYEWEYEQEKKKQSEQSYEHTSGLKYILTSHNLHFSSQNVPQCPTK